MRTTLLLLPFALLAGCDFILPDDDDDGDPGLVADADGTVYRLSAGVDSVSVVWTADVAATDSVSFAVSGDTVVVGAGSRVHGLAAADGTELWTADVIDQVVAMTQGGGRAYALGFTAMTAIDVADGAVLWTADFTADGIAGVSFAAPVFADGGVILGGDPVRRFEGSNGAPDGTWTSGDTEMLGLAVDGGRVYAGGRNGISALGADLSESWSHDTPEEVDRIAPTGAGIVYSQVGAGVSLISSAGEPGWSVDDGAVYESLVAAESAVVGARLQGSVHAWNAADGAELWTVTDTSSPVRGLAVTGATILYGGGEFVQGLDPGDGSVLWEWSPGANPVGVSAF